MLELIDLLYCVVKSSIFFLIFCLVAVSIIESRVLKSPTIIVELSVSPFNSVSFCIICLITCYLLYKCL